MNKSIYSLLLLLVLLLPLKTYAQEDTCVVPNLLGTGLFLNQIIAQDTAGTGWKGASGVTAWQNHTRVYILQKNGTYPCNASLGVGLNRKLSLRGEPGNYIIPAMGNLAIDFKPIIRFEPAGTASTPQGNFCSLNGATDTLVLKNIAMVGIDEDLTGTLDLLQGSLLVLAASGTGSIYVDSCLLKTINGQIIQTAGRPFTVQVTNSVLADLGFLGTSNFGAGKGVDLRNSEVDSIFMINNTIVNYQDRVIRHFLSLKPIHAIKFNHNTVINGMAYDGMLSFGWVDSLSNGSFEIKDNLFLDNFSMGPDTDLIRQGEFSDSPDKDGNNNQAAMSWVIARANSTGHITPWVIKNNYFARSDSGNAVRLATSQLHVPYHIGQAEPILTSDIKRQLQANGGDTTNAFKQCRLSFGYVPKLMTKLTRWYWTNAGDGTVGATVDQTFGAGAGKQKTGSSGTPAAHFIKLSPGVWAYDFDRKTTFWYLDSLNANFGSELNLRTASSDGKVIGSTMWAQTSDLTGVATVANQLPGVFALNQNYPNPFNPTTQITFDVPKASFVSIKVYNVLGQEVATLVNSFQQAGSHPATWNAAGFGSGIYFVKMQAGSFTATKKMILMK